MNMLGGLVLVGICIVISQTVYGANRPVRQVDSSANHAKVLILGAGASGLQAARSLHDAGMDDFIIVEGANRIGGRLRNTQFAGQTVETGAGWLYSENAPRTYKIAKGLNLVAVKSDFDSFIVRNETGQNVTSQGLADFDKLVPATKKMLSIADRLNSNGGEKISDMSQRAGLRIGGWNPQSSIEHTVEWYNFDFEYSTPTEVYSTKESVGSFGDRFFMKDPRGYKAIFDIVAGFLKEPEFINHTRLNQRVVSIDQSDPASVVVTCEDGTEYTADQVLVTFSLGVLQNDLVKFIPPLPEWKDVVIKKSLMAAYTHIYLSFPTKFWDDTEWILHASSRRGYYPAFFNLQTDGFYPDGKPMLLGTVTGDDSRRVDAQPLSQTKAEIEEVLRNMYGDGIPDIDDILVSGWTSNPLTMGSYSGWAVELPTYCKPLLRSRVDRIFFGGEATSPDYYGYVDGALNSGEREASKILNCMSNSQDCPMYEGRGLGCHIDETSDNSTSNLGSFSMTLFALVINMIGKLICCD